MQHAAAQHDVVGRVGVALQLVVSAAVAVYLDVPRAAIERLEPGTVEVVAKEIRLRHWRRHLHWRCHHHWRRDLHWGHHCRATTATLTGPTVALTGTSAGPVTRRQHPVANGRHIVRDGRHVRGCRIGHVEHGNRAFGKHAAVVTRAEAAEGKHAAACAADEHLCATSGR